MQLHWTSRPMTSEAHPFNLFVRPERAAGTIGGCQQMSTQILTLGFARFDMGPNGGRRQQLDPQDKTSEPGHELLRLGSNGQACQCSNIARRYSATASNLTGTAVALRGCPFSQT